MTDSERRLACGETPLLPKLVLYLVATPIGNLEDMTYRAVRILREVAVIAAEDTRHTGRLLKHFEIDTPLVSFHEYSSEQALNDLLGRLASADVALVSDAGTPSISDPGYRLVRAAIAAGHTIVPIPGPSASTTALIASGLPTDKFAFLGFLPQKQKARRDALTACAQLSMTLIFYESPNRLLATLSDMQTVWGEREVCVARELTKQYEEFWRGSLAAAHAEFAGRERIRGEITLVVAGASAETQTWDETRVTARLKELLNEGLPRSKAASQLAKMSGWRKRQIYNLDV